MSSSSVNDELNTDLPFVGTFMVHPNLGWCVRIVYGQALHQALPIRANILPVALKTGHA